MVAQLLAGKTSEYSRCDMGPGEIQSGLFQVYLSQGHRECWRQFKKKGKYTRACGFFNKFIEQFFCEADQHFILKPPVPVPGGSWPSSGRRGLSSEPETAWHGST